MERLKTKLQIKKKKKRALRSRTNLFALFLVIYDHGSTFLRSGFLIKCIDFSRCFG